MESTNEYCGITHNIPQYLFERALFLKQWKEECCPKGKHLFDEVWSQTDHYLHCDICGMEVHISHIIKPS